MRSLCEGEEDMTQYRQSYFDNIYLSGKSENGLRFSKQEYKIGHHMNIRN